MTRKSPAFAGRAFLFRGMYAEVIDASGQEEKHDRAGAASRHRGGAGPVWAGIRGGYCAWVR